MLCGTNLVNQFFKYKRKALLNLSLSNRRWKATNQKTRILFFGTDNFSLPSLIKLHREDFDVSVTTSFKSPANCVRNYAEQQKLPLHRWPITAEHCSAFDVGVVVSFGHLIPLSIINAVPRGIINVHASLLPRWRGAAPIMHAIMAGDDTTGISIMKIAPHRFDIGPILAQRELPITKDVFLPELHTSLSQLGAELLVETLNSLDERLLNARPQNEAAASYAPKISSNITEIIWPEQTSKDVFARYRAIYGFKHLTTIFEGKSVTLMELKQPEELLSSHLVPSPGSIYYHRARKSLIIGCAQSTQIEVLQLRVEGKKPITAQDFNNGFLKRANSQQFIQNKLS